MVTRYEQFSSAISAIYRNIQKIERDEMILYGAKGAFAQYLTALYRHPDGLTAAQLCELCDKDKAAVSRAVNEMAERGLILREDGTAYRTRICLSPEGQQTAAHIFRRAQTAVEVGGKGLSDEHRAAFYAALNLIAANLETVARNGLPPERTNKESD